MIFFLIWCFIAIIFFSLSYMYFILEEVFTGYFFFVCGITSMFGVFKWLIEIYENYEIDQQLKKSKENPTLPKEEKKK